MGEDEDGKGEGGKKSTLTRRQKREFTGATAINNET